MITTDFSPVASFGNGLFWALGFLSFPLILNAAKKPAAVVAARVKAWHRRWKYIRNARRGSWDVSP